MADIKTLQTRIALKYDSYTSWIDETKEGLGANLVLLAGEIGLCEIPGTTKTVKEGDKVVQVTTAPTVLFKVGNGTDTFKALPWASAKAADVYDWAKKSEEEFKTWLDTEAKFATDAEVAAAVKAEKDLREAADSALDARITAIEGSVGTGKVAEDITAIKGRLDVIEGEGDGSIAAGDAATLESAKAYADGLAGNYDAAGSAATAKSEAIAAAKSETESQVAALKGTLEAKDAELNTAIEANATAIATEKSARESAINTINNKLDVEKVSTAIATAKQEAIDSAATTAQGKVDDLANGQVKTNTAAIATNAGEISRVEGLVTAEAKAREDADKVIDERLEKVEAFFDGAAEDSEGLNNALDKLVDIQNYLAGEGSGADGLMGQVSANAQSIINLNKEFAEGGRVTKAESAIDDVEADIAEYKGQMTTALAGKQDVIAENTYDTYGSASKALEDAKDYADGLAGNYEVAGAAAKALTDAKAYTDSEVDKLEATDAELQDNINNKLDKSTFEAHEEGHAKSATEITAEIAAAVKVETDARAEAVNDINTKIGTIDGTVASAIAGVKETAERADAKSIDNGNILATLTGDNGRVTVAEGKITALESTVGDSNSGLVKSVADLVALTGDNGAIRSEIATAKKAGDDAAAAVDTLSKGQVATNKTDIATLSGKITAIEAREAHYLEDTDVFIFNCGSSTEVVHK